MFYFIFVLYFIVHILKNIYVYVKYVRMYYLMNKLEFIILFFMHINPFIFLFGLETGKKTIHSYIYLFILL